MPCYLQSSSYNFVLFTAIIAKYHVIYSHHPTVSCSTHSFTPLLHSHQQNKKKWSQIVHKIIRLYYLTRVISVDGEMRAKTNTSAKIITVQETAVDSQQHWLSCDSHHEKAKRRKSDNCERSPLYTDLNTSPGTTVNLC